ncbi:MAG TPA: 7-cyano-7-deazaguanine synthase QueC [Marinobacter hydrocarbonoclasticus]|nr:7-cyano-7-deazaguanine synthase QueC [Alcanivorax sp.]MAY11262.1 7-cyano-7-deazaguanine synthase QueC [Alcanivorax sp.]MBI55167.1 7-cyano-7-deazaguanine synthase QueC [Alcanivorax sp.]HAX10108.1 7-cyano-7-deazaguanine synthase QueC [Marinobacter nauticus]HCE40153.1 7-cyano-7-deazaguanine synthase QueC [Alcanivorax sp.]|tara:strand:+ start:460 stop:1128 length:669 start_codon:yes stop_codon:yes gene_type:complete
MNTAVVLLSGGLDSATCLAIARDRGYRCHTIAFDYGQRTRSELDAAARVSAALGAESHRVIELGLGSIGGSALTDHDIEVPEEGGDGIPVTYVPARNTVFLSLALGLAEVVDAEAIFIGVNAVDYSGYPDCRPEFIDAFQNLARLATKAGVEGHPIEIATPLMHLSKADIIRRGTDLGLDYGLTVSCYQADEAGRACGRCDSCRLRRQGFEEALVKDPTVYR